MLIEQSSTILANIHESTYNIQDLGHEASKLI